MKSYSLLLLLTVSIRRAASLTMKNTGIVWYKPTDLRLADHLPLTKAHAECSNVNHVFIFDPRHFNEGSITPRRCSYRRFNFLCESVNTLSYLLKQRGSTLNIAIGRPEVIIPKLAKELSCSSVYCHDEVASEELQVLQGMRNALAKDNISLEKLWGGTLVSKDELPMRLDNLSIFTAFRKAVENNDGLTKLPLPLPVPEIFKPNRDIPAILDWNGVELGTNHFPADSTFPSIVQSIWRTVFNGDDEVGVADSAEMDSRSAFPYHGGELAAMERIQHYITNGVGRVSVYKETRNGMIGADFSTKLSPWLALGCVSARTVMQRVKDFEKSSGIKDENTYWVIFELLWRDYMRFYGLRWGKKMFYLGGPQGEAGRRKQPWGRDAHRIQAWKEGRTGYPIIDANMRELLSSGFMSNRGRQIVASFFVRDLGQDWRIGAEHFERYLLDHDVCSNYGKD